MERLDQKSVWLFFISFILVGAFILFFIIFLFAITSREFDAFEYFLKYTDLVYQKINLFTVSVFLAVAYIYGWYSWKNYRYELTADGFKKESGIIIKHYVTIPYDRIQNVNIIRGIPTRLLGLSDLQIQTAGMSGMAGAEGILPGLNQEKAEQIRKELIQKAEKASK